MWAAVENHPAVVELLIENGGDVHARSTAGFTALLFAARQGNLKVARILVDAGADVNDHLPDGVSVLALATENVRYEVAAFLLDEGADPNAVNKQGETPLHAAVRTRVPSLRRRAADDLDSLELLNVLLAHGAYPNVRTPKAPRITDAMVASQLRPAIDNVLNLGGATPFLLAAQTADVAAMRLLLDRGADARLATYENTTALMVAAGVGFVEGRARARPETDALEAAKLTVEMGVDINTTNERGQTALHGAVYRAANSIIQFLVSAGARTDLQDELGRTPLELAESGFNQVSSVIRRESSAALLRTLTGRLSRSAPQ
jgi:ankyrin repeat protein